MSRLVDADALIEVIKESRPLNWTDSESELQEDADYNHFIEMVKEQPTAYSIEKVMAELKKEMNDAITLWDDSDYYTGRADAFESAIEIVKAGGMK